MGAAGYAARFEGGEMKKPYVQLKDDVDRHDEEARRVTAEFLALAENGGPGGLEKAMEMVLTRLTHLAAAAALATRQAEELLRLHERLARRVGALERRAGRSRPLRR
jgi:hypothetical protein